jgi:hypothetical protein
MWERIHEELIAHVADQEGYFEDEGVHVSLRDGAVWKTERVRGGATIGLGSAHRQHPSSALLVSRG